MSGFGQGTAQLEKGTCIVSVRALNSRYLDIKLSGVDGYPDLDHSIRNKIREKLIDLSVKNNFEPIFPPKNLCSDNAAMIAWDGIERFKLGFSNKLDFSAKT